MLGKLARETKTEAVLNALRDRLASAGIREGILRHLLIRTTADDREAIAMLVVTRNDKALRAPIRAFLEKNPAAHIVLLDPHNEYAHAFNDMAEVIENVEDEEER